jgi:hypothetical protein
MNHKFKDIGYLQGHVSEEVRKEISLDDIYSFLAKLGCRKTAVIFYARGSNSLCTWLILHNGELISVKKNFRNLDLQQ